MKPGCEHPEEELVALRERGEDLPSALAACPTCQQRARALDWIARTMLHPLPHAGLSAGWERRIVGADAFRAVPATAGSTRRASRRWIPASAAALALCGALFLLLRAGDRPPEPPAPIRLAIVAAPLAGPATSRMRGSERGPRSAAPGDRLVASAPLTGSRHTELRVYRNRQELIARCSDRPPCRREADRIALDLVLATAGDYQVVLVAADGPLPAPRGVLSLDVEQLRLGRARVELAPPVSAW